MTRHYRNCIYIHGLHSSVNYDKTAILEKYFHSVTALDIDYLNQQDAFSILEETCLREKVDFIVGSSFGGYLGFYLSRELQLPAVLFNPGMYFAAQDKTFIPVKSDQASPFAYLVMGQQDEVVPVATTEIFLKENEVADNIHAITCDWLPHLIDLKTFEAMMLSGIALSK